MDRHRQLVGVLAERERQTPLWVEVDEQHPSTLLRHRRTQRRHRRRLGHPTLLIGDRKYSRHGVHPSTASHRRTRGAESAGDGARIARRERQAAASAASASTRRDRVVPERQAHQPHRPRTHRDRSRARRKRRPRRIAQLNLDNPFVISSPRKRAMVHRRTGRADRRRGELRCSANGTTATTRALTTHEIRKTVPDWLVWTHGCPGGETTAAVSERADRAIALALEHMETRDVVFVGHGHFSRAVITRWVELPVYEGIRFAMAAASIAVCGFEHGVRQLNALGSDRIPPPDRVHVTREPTFVLATAGSAVVADGVHTTYKSIADARTSLTSHSAPIILGALPFDISRPAALIRPQDVAVPRRAAEVAAAPAAHGAGRGDAAGPRRAPRPDRARRWRGCAIRRAGCTRWCWPVRCGWWPTGRSTHAPSSTAWSPPTRRPTPTSST